MAKLKLDQAPMRFRAATLREAPMGVDRAKRVIRGFALIERGEALGHELWIDESFLDQVATAAGDGHGLKCRYTHPSLSSDGMGTVLGRVRNVYRDGDRVRGDLHILQAADDSPKGRLGDYVMKLAEEAPDLFGASIVFDRDRDAERSYATDNVDDDEEFQSPDPRNERNLKHARLSDLYACDVVDEPAANPNGFFSDAQEIAARADALLSFSLGLTEDLPDVETLGIHPDRARQFVRRFLANHQLAVTHAPKETAMSDPCATKPEGAASATLAELKAEFPGDNRAIFREQMLEQGATLAVARLAFAKLERDEAQREAVKLREELAARAKADEDARATAAEFRVPGPGAAHYGAIEVGESKQFSWDNPTVKRAFGDEKAFSAFNDVDIDPITGKPGRVPRKVLGAMLHALTVQSQAHPHIAFAMGRSGPDYADITVKGIVGRFYKSIVDEFAASWAMKLMWLNSESNQETETYKWLGQVPQLREWIGGRQSQGLGINSFAITNKTWEATLEFDIEDWRFDKTGQINLRYAELAATAIDHWHKRITDQIEADGLCYDGQNFFDTDHPAADRANGAGANAATYKNEVVSGDIGALNVVTAAAPTPDEMVLVALGVLQHFKTFKDGHSRPYNDGMREVCFMVPNNMEGAIIGALRDRLRDAGSTNTVLNYGLKLDHIVNSRLTSTTVGYAFRTDSAMKAFIGQEPVAPELTFLGEGSDEAFKNNKYLGGLKAVREVDYGQWAHAIKFTLS